MEISQKLQKFQKNQKELEEYFRWFHEHPELGHEEFETTARIREILDSLGVAIMDTGLPTGLVAKMGRGERTIALRCDIDALPINEETGLVYAAKNGRMHACGHDFHLTAMLGAAMLLKEREARLNGTVKLVFQPAEETVNGGRSVLKSGALDDVMEIYGLHTKADLPLGYIGARTGAAYAAVGSFSVTIRGRGGHAAHPHECRDPVVAAAQIINAAQTVVSRSVSPLGTVRALGTDTFATVRNALERVCQGAAQAAGVDVEFRFESNTSAVNNDEKLTSFVVETAHELGLDAGDCPPTMGGEDFSEYQKRIRGVFWNIGVESPAPAHNPRFAANPAALGAASAFLSALAEKSLKRLATND